ncbi:MAG: hypothetical protein QF793_03930, partial [Candidatus Peribacteraceae bacterium]|nr:hypothetical protein [Candidatus Peribacteraceae bacterium]
MKTLRSIIATVSILTLCAGVIPPAQASGISGGALGNGIRNASPRGFKRSISRARDKLNTECQHLEDANEKRRCVMDYRKMIRDEATPVTEGYVDYNLERRSQNCGHFPRITDRRACMRSLRARIPQGNRRALNKRTRTRAVKEQREECREKETSAERLRCLRSQGNARRSKVIQLDRRRPLMEKAPVNF